MWQSTMRVGKVMKGLTHTSEVASRASSSLDTSSRSCFSSVTAVCPVLTATSEPRGSWLAGSCSERNGELLLRPFGAQRCPGAGYGTMPVGGVLASFVLL